MFVFVDVNVKFQSSYLFSPQTFASCIILFYFHIFLTLPLSSSSAFPLSVSLQLPLFFPIVFCLCSVFLVVVPLYSDTINTLVGIAVALSGVPVYYVCIHLPPSSRPAFIQKILGKKLQLMLSCMS